MNIDNLNLTSDPAVQYGPALSRDIPAVSEEEFDETIRRAIKTYGKDSRTQMLFEEMAELQDALCKLTRGRDTRAHVCEESADVLIMCLQMAQIYGPKAVENWINIKINRLKNRLDNPQEPPSITQK